MDATVKGAFWTDARVEDLDSNRKLACLWLMTNPARDLLGFTHVSAKRFIFETGLSLSVLEGACEGLPTSFKALPENWYFAVNFLRHQFGAKGGQLALTNNVVKAAIRQAKTLRSPLQAAFLQAYPELEKSVLSEGGKGSPSEGVIETAIAIAKHVDGKGVQGKTHGGDANGAPSPETIVGAYPRREATAECLMIVAGHIASGESPESMLAGTKAIADAIGKLPSGPRNGFVLGAPRFFREKRWQDDPETWLRQADLAGSGKKGGTMSEEEIREALGGRA